MRRRLFAIVVCWCALLAWCEMGATPSGAQGWPVHHWNMTASAGDSHYVTDHDIALWSVAADHPVVVSFNEICLGVASRLKAELRARGYAAEVSVRNYVGTVSASSACRPGDSRGNMVFVVGANHQSSCSSSTCAIALTQASGDGDTRKVICNRTDTFLGPLVGCSTHLTWRGQSAVPSVAQQQAEQVRFGVSSLYPGVLKFVAGDFNLRPPHDGTVPSNRHVPGGWYTHYLEGSHDEATTTTGIKIDHIFGQRNLLAYRWVPVLEDFPGNEHLYYKAAFFS